MVSWVWLLSLALCFWSSSILYHIFHVQHPCCINTLLKKINLATLGLSCGTWDLGFHCGLQGLEFRCVGFFSGDPFFKLSCGMWDAFSCSIWDLVPWPRIEPKPPALGTRRLVTGPPGKSLVLNFCSQNRVDNWADFHFHFLYISVTVDAEKGQLCR